MYAIKAKGLNFKNMKEALVNGSEGKEREMRSIYWMFYQMACLDFIDWKTWRKFEDACSGWYVEEDSHEVIDISHGYEVIWAFRDGEEYKA